MPLGRRRSREINVWPGFVDALTSLIIAIVFVLLIFTIAQFTLSEALSGRDEALKQLNRRISELAEMLSLERKTNADLQLSISQLSAELQSSVLKRDTLAGRLSEITAERDKLNEQLAAIKGTAQGAASEAESLKAQLADALKALQAEKGSADEKARELAQLEQEIAILKSLREDLESKLEQSQQSVTTEKQVSSEAQRQVDLLNRQLLALRDQLSQIEQALEVAEQANKNKDVQIADLGKRLNLALAGKVEELARYRSEFFGRLRQVLGDRTDVRIVGDRFVFQSEVLFEAGSAELGEEGKQQLARLAATLRDLIGTIPKDINWVLRIDGHTDKRPIASAQFPSNWELSAARAIAVAKFLTTQGINPKRLVPAGFGEFSPIDPGDTEDAFRKNRRIEFKLTEG
jgi:chemotaxis protein MotB